MERKFSLGVSASESLNRFMADAVLRPMEAAKYMETLARIFLLPRAARGCPDGRLPG